LGGGDTLKGLQGGDRLNGAGGDDDLFGGAGGDTIYGGIGHDVAHGKRNGDYINGIDGTTPYSAARKKQRTVDVLIGDSGNDTFRAKDGNKDIIRGGPGHDKAYVDKVDNVKGVEKVVVPGGGGGTGGGNPNPIAPQKKQCEDGKDNDNDGKTDLQDPGCAKATDNTENAPPVANDDTLTTCCGYPEDINVINNPDPAGVDTDADGDNLRVSSFTQPSHGKVKRYASSPDEKLLYTPKAGFPSCKSSPCPDGTDSFDYTVSDGHGGTDTGTVDVTVYAPDCADGKDNDNDGKIDFGNGPNNDPDCDSLTDQNEYQ
jgi:Bacterial Ig domain/RTX calcium-binding nonapeptide repeat (4 copies)